MRPAAAEAVREPARRPGQRATAIAALTTVVAVLPVFLVGGLAVQLEEDLGMTASALGVAVATFWAVSALLSAPAGYVASGLGLRRGVPLAVGLGFVALAGIAFITPHWAWLIVWLGFAGAANALIHPLSNGLIVDQVAVRNRAFSFGLKQAAHPDGDAHRGPVGSGLRAHRGVELDLCAGGAAGGGSDPGAPPHPPARRPRPPSLG